MESEAPAPPITYTLGSVMLLGAAVVGDVGGLVTGGVFPPEEV